jgi:hypothetical protein
MTDVVEDKDVARKPVALGNVGHERLPADDGSAELLSVLRSAREVVSKPKADLWLELPGYEGKVVACYSVVEWDTIKEIGSRVGDSKDRRKELLGHAATIGAACREIFVVSPGGRGEYLEDLGLCVRPLSEVIGLDYPCKFMELAAHFGDNVDNTTAAVMAVLAPVGSKREWSVTLHHNELMEWMGEARKSINDDFLGESNAAKR